MLKESGDVPIGVQVYELDVSHERIQCTPNTFDFAFCTESVEHFSNPYFAFANVKKALKHGGVFVVAFPMPEDNGWASGVPDHGFGSGEHAHVYPGLLLRDSFNLFMRQLYFQEIQGWDNGSTHWSIWANFKHETNVDVFAMGSGNYTEEQLFGRLDAWTP